MNLLTRPYRISRLHIALMTAEEYALSYFWAFLGFPVFGILAVTLAPNAIIRQMGWLCLLWPLTIPIRAFSASAGAASQYDQEVVLAEDADGFYLLKGSKGVRILRTRIRGYTFRRGYYRLKVGAMGQVFVPASAFLGEVQEDQVRGLNKLRF